MGWDFCWKIFNLLHSIMESFRWNYNAFFMSAIAGLSTGLGGLFVILYGKPDQFKLGHLLSFSAGVMIYISFMDLLPEASEKVGFVKANLSFFIGMLVFGLMTKFIPDDFGHEHGHSSPKSKKTNEVMSEKLKKKNELRRVGIVTALGISLHNFPEGIAVYLSCLRGIEVGLPIAIAIAAHNIPEGMAVASPIYHSTKSKWEAIKYSLLSGICEPVAALIFGVFLSPYISEDFIHCLLAGVAGIMILVSLQELLPTAFKYLNPERAMISLTSGMIFIGVTVFYLHSGSSHGHDHGSPHTH